MGAARALISRAVVALAIAVPWLALVQPRHMLGRGLLATLVFAASFHGWGRGLASLVRRSTDPALAVAWGAALVTAFLGVTMAASLRAQLPLLVIGLVLHGVSVGLRFRAASEAVEAALRGDMMRWWLVPAILIVAIGGLHVLGAAGAVPMRPFDDDGHVLAQVRRLLDTGTLGDPVGYARATQLGASITLGALGPVFGDLAFVRLIDALGFVLVLVLVCRAIGLRDATTTLWAGLVIVTLGFVAVLWPDPAPLWLPIALALALAQTVGEQTTTPAMLMPAGLLAGALIVLRLEWLPFAAVLAAAAWQPREHTRARLVRIGVLVAATLLVVVPYVLVRVRAWSHVSHAVTELVVPGRRTILLNALVAVAIAAAALPVTWLVFARGAGRVVRWTALATIASVAGVVGRFTATAPYYSRYLWPIVTACVLIILVDVVRTASARVSALAMVLVAGGVLLGYEARLAHSHQRLLVHYDDLVMNIDYARSTQPRAATDPDYEKLLALVPRGSVAVWVVRPERLDYSHHTLLDLRVPRLWRQRARPWEPERADGVVRVLRAAKLRYLLIEDDGAAQRYAEENPLARVLCDEQCLDPLARMLAGQRLLATSGATRLYELRW